MIDVDAFLRGGVDQDRTLRELTPELRRHLARGLGTGTLMVQHPFVWEPIRGTLGEAAQLNEQLRWKRRVIRDARREEAWDDYLWAYVRPHRIAALLEIEPLVDDDVQWWSLVTVCWVDSENIFQSVDTWRSIFTLDRPERSAMMTDEDEIELAAMPERLTVYRGACCADGIGSGMSWSLDRTRATWFARRYAFTGMAPKHHEATVEKRHVVAYISGRQEREVIVLPEHVEIVRTRELAPA